MIALAKAPEHIRFSSTILPPYARRSKSLEVLIPILYLKGVSTGDFEEALAALLGKDAGGLSATRPSGGSRRPGRRSMRAGASGLSAKHYVYFWADGIHVQARLEDAAAVPAGHHRRHAGGQEGASRPDRRRARECAILEGAAARPEAPRACDGAELAVADGALGFWQAIEEVWPKTRGQRCWVHKTANVLNKLPKSQQSKAKRALQEIWMAETKKDALAAFDAFVETWGVKYDKAVECLSRIARRCWPSTTSRPSTVT